MCPVEPPEGNGKLLKYRVDALEHRHKATEQAYKFLAEVGARTNEQVRVHEQRLDEHDRRLDSGDHALEKEREERETVDGELRAADTKVLWLLVTTAVGLAAATLSFALGLVPT